MTASTRAWRRAFLRIGAGVAGAALVVTGATTAASAISTDTNRPEVVLVSPTTAGPFERVQIRVDATDDVGLQRIVANIYDSTNRLVKSTQTAILDSASDGTHSATVDLPVGTYTIKYNAQDLAGNISRTGQFAFEVAVAPLVDVTVTPRMLADKAYLSVKAENTSTAPLDIVITTPYGGKTFADVAPGASVGVAVNSRLGAVPAGSALVTAAGAVGGEPVSYSATTSYGAFPTVS